eukprot:633845-Amphidinium_carterae.1
MGCALLPSACSDAAGKGTNTTTHHLSTWHLLRCHRHQPYHSQAVASHGPSLTSLNSCKYFKKVCAREEVRRLVGTSIRRQPLSCASWMCENKPELGEEKARKMKKFPIKT